MQETQKDWLVRTRTGEILGPYTQNELYEELRRKRFSVDDEIAPSAGNWISAQALNYREGDDFTRTSTRSQALGSGTNPSIDTTGTTDVDEELTPTPEFARPPQRPSHEVPAHAQTGPPLDARPRFLRLVLAVIVIFALWAFTLLLRSKPQGPQPPQPVAPKTGTMESDSALLREIYGKIRLGDTKGALKQLTSFHESAAAKNEIDYLVPYSALLIIEQDSLERARRLLRSVTHSSARDSVRAEALMWLGYSHLVQDKDSEDRAESYFLESLQLNPKSPATRYNLGRAYFKKGKYLEALDYLQLAELEVPDLWLVHIHKGNARALLGQKEEARKALRLAIERAPDRWYPHMVYAAFLNRIGDSDAAQSTLRNMFLKDPSFETQTPPPFGFYQEPINYLEYLSAYNVIMKEAPGDDRDFGRIYLSYLNGFANDEGAAELKYLERLAERGHFPARILSLKISVDHFVDEQTLAYRLNRVPVDVRKFGPYAYVIRGEAKMRLGKTEEAIEEFNKALTLDARSAAARHSIAMSLKRAERRNEAREQINQLLSIHPDYIPALQSQDF